MTGSDPATRFRGSGPELDRVAGALVGLAAGDALGAGYEFDVPDPEADIGMVGGGLGPWAPGEWTDDTQQAICIARVAATGTFHLDQIGQALLDWLADVPKDVGISTRAVLGAASSPADLPDVAARYFASHPKGAAGNGSLMRTAPVALTHLGDDEAIADAAMAVSALTHGDPLAGEACVLWCIAIDRAVRQQRLDGVWDGLDLLPADRRDYWRTRLDEAELEPPARFRPNGFVVPALQAAHAAIVQTPLPEDRPARHLQDALETAVRIGGDTDTVAAIAGQVLGARWGVSAVPWRWRQLLHGWPGLATADLVRLAILTARDGKDDAIGWPSTDSLAYYGHQQEPTAVCVPLPDDPDLLLGNLPGLEIALGPPGQGDVDGSGDVGGRGVDAVVSLCRMGQRQVPDDVEHVRVWLVDQPDANPNLEFVVADTVDGLATLRRAGKRVYLHCVGGRSRTPTVAAAYLIAHHDRTPEEALAQLADALPELRLNARFQQYVADPV